MNSNINNPEITDEFPDLDTTLPRAKNLPPPPLFPIENKVNETVIPDKPGLIDKILSKIISRKLTVFAISTVLLWYNILDPDKWYQIALLYIGMQAMEDMVKLWKLGE